MRDALDDLIAAYEELLPAIRGEDGSGWILFANRRQVKKFAGFSEAARYAREHYGKQPVLIRHTDERKVEAAPFIHVLSGG